MTQLANTIMGQVKLDLETWTTEITSRFRKLDQLMTPLKMRLLLDEQILQTQLQRLISMILVIPTGMDLGQHYNKQQIQLDNQLHQVQKLEQRLNVKDDEIEVCEECKQELHERTCSKYNEYDEWGEDY